VSFGGLNIPTFTPGVKLYPQGIDPMWEATPPSAGTVPSAAATWTVRDQDGHVVLHLDVCPVVFEALTRQTTLYQSVVVRVVYTAAEPVAVTELSPIANRVAPQAAIRAVARVVNGSDASVSVTPTLRVLDVLGLEVANATGEPSTIAAGETVNLHPWCPAPALEGSYTLVLEVDREGEIVTSADTLVEVTAGHIEAFTAPAVVVPVRPITLSVTYANTSLVDVDADVSLQVLDIVGGLEDDLGTVTRVIRAGATETATFTWNVRSVPLGTYLLRATVTPGNRASRTLTRRVEVALQGVRRPRRWH
jgi:hypothetical protein